MHLKKRVILLISVCSCNMVSAQTNASPDCDANLVIPNSVYESAGLEKLSETERKSLLDWARMLNCNGAKVVDSKEVMATGAKTEAVDIAPVRAAEADLDNFGIPVPTYDESKKMQASVKEPFRGWTGKTVFYLDNGQVWRQRVSGKYTYGGDDNRVEISQNSLGFFEMRLLATDREVGVSRVR